MEGPSAGCSEHGHWERLGLTLLDGGTISRLLGTRPLGTTGSDAARWRDHQPAARKENGDQSKMATLHHGHKEERSAVLGRQVAPLSANRPIQTIPIAQLSRRLGRLLLHHQENSELPGLFDLKVPLTSLEVHLMTRLLDPDDAGEVDYTQLKQGLQLARENLILDKDAEYDSLVLEVTRTKFPPCPCCKMSIVPPFTEPYPRYISLDLRMVTFESFKDYPGHLDLMVHAHLPVCCLIQMIVDITQITSTKIAVFRDRSRSRESLLPPKSTLQDCGFVGDSRSDPEEVVLFYDYTVEFTDCPILLCDHYFGQKLHA
ncbi:hypothetical protein ACOMHN_033980 [Nucella lapillus]